MEQQITFAAADQHPPERPAPRFRCDVCNQGFTRTDHLKRHYLRHSGLKPYVCGFCNAAFARCDSLRNHYNDCPNRGDRPIPETDQKGRRRHACTKCISMKLKCDGNNPCASCQKRGMSCEHVDRPSTGDTPTKRRSSETATQLTAAQPRTNGHAKQPSTNSDRHNDMGSIKFLLNGGQDGFMEDLSFPGRQRTHSSSTPTHQPTPQPAHAFPTNPMNFAVDPNYGQVNELPPNALNSFFEGPFDALHQQWRTSLSAVPPTDSLWLYNNASPDSSDYTAYAEPHTPNVAALLDALLITLADLNPHPQRQQELTADVRFLLAPQRVRRFVALYGKVWHPNCPIIHMASFDSETVTLPLLASVVSMGAMYSADQRELSAAKSVLDLVELFIFSCDLFSNKNEIRRAMVSSSRPDTPMTIDWLDFQSFQAAYLNVTVQHWAGNELARDRSMEIRFSQVVRIARAMSLHKVRHHPKDASSQELWLQKECQIRTMNIIHALDCAFLFFHNYPCRMSFAEMECDLPCDELLFSSLNPFAEADFKVERGITLRRGFESLFEPGSSLAPGEHFRILDMFLLIHGMQTRSSLRLQTKLTLHLVLYAFIITRLVLRAPFGPPLPPPDSSNNNTSSSAPQSRRPTDPATTAGLNAPDPVISRILEALRRWRELWTATCDATTTDAWTVTGFFKASYKYWLVAQLVATKHGQVEGGWLLEPKCAGKLERLQTLAS